LHTHRLEQPLLYNTQLAQQPLPQLLLLQRCDCTAGSTPPP
jgi:hypothetical protein